MLLKKYLFLLIALFFCGIQFLTAQAHRYGIYANLSANIYNPFSANDADFKEKLIPSYSIGFLMQFYSAGNVIPEAGLSIRNLKREYDLEYTFREVGNYFQWVEHVERSATILSLPTSLNFHIQKVIFKMGVVNSIIVKNSYSNSFAFIQEETQELKNYINIDLRLKSRFVTEFLLGFEYGIFNNTVVRIEGRYNHNTGNYRSVLPQYSLALGTTYLFE